MGHKIELYATGESIEFTRVAGNRFKDVTEMIITLPANGEGPPLHLHPLQTENFEVLQGALCLVVNGKKTTLVTGEQRAVLPGAAHNCFALNNQSAVCRVTFSPGLHIDYILTEIVASCNRRKAAFPSIFDVAYILHQARGQYYLARLPKTLQRLAFAIISNTGQALGLVKARNL